MVDVSGHSKAIYPRLLHHVVPYRRTFALGVAAMIVLGLTEPAIPAILERVVGSFERQTPDTVPLYAALFLGLFFIRGLSSFLSTFALESVAARLVQDLRRHMFDRLMRIPAPAYDNVASGTLISKVTFDAQQVADAATHAVTAMVRDSVAAIGLLGWMLWLDWKLTFIALATAPAVIAVVVYFSRRLRRMSHGLQRTMGDVTHVLQEGIEGHKVVKVFSGQTYETRRFADAANRARRFQVKFASAAAATAPIAQMITAFALAIILLLSAWRFENGAITISDFVSFFTAMALLFSPLKRLTSVNATVQKGIAAAASVFALIDSPVEADTRLGPDTAGQGSAGARRDHVPLSPGGPAGARFGVDHHRAGRDGGPRRAFRKRQDDDRRPDPAVPRPRDRPRQARRHRSARPCAGVVARQRRARQPGHRPSSTIRWRRTSPMAPPPAHRARQSPPRRVPRTPWSSSTRCPTDWTRSSANAA